MFAINTGKNVHVIPPSRYDLDIKYKLILDLSSKIDLQQRQFTSLSQLYSTKHLNVCQQLCEEVKLLFRYAPIEYGRMCEELLWKRNYYDYVKFFKKSRKNLSDTELMLFRVHLISGVGHYHSLILSFKKVFSLSILDNLISYCPNNRTHELKLSNILSYNVTDFTSDGDSNSISANKLNDFNLDEFENSSVRHYFDLDYVQDEKFNSTLNYLVHRFYICIGDLARYYVDFYSGKDHLKVSSAKRFAHPYFNVAALYYTSASIIEPTLGMPFNQLGTLYSDKFFGIDSLYYYFRCLNSKKTFEGVIANMRQTFSLSLMQNSTKKHVVNGNVGNDNSSEDILKKSILEMIGLFSAIFNVLITMDEQCTISADNLIVHSNKTLDYFTLAMNVNDELTCCIQKATLTTDNVFKIISIIILLIERIHVCFRKNSFEIDFNVRNEKSISDVKAKANFILLHTYQFLARLMTVVIKRDTIVIKAKLYGFNSSKNCMNLMDMFNEDVETKTKKNVSKKLSRYQHSLSLDLGDHDDSATLHQLKSTAFTTIADILDSSDIEDNGDVNCIKENENNLDEDFDEDFFEKFYYENNSDDNDCLSADINSNVAKSRKTTEKLIDIPSIDSNNLESEPKPMDQLLSFVYTQSNAPNIKFFADYFQSNEVFRENITKILLPEFYQTFSEYFNTLSEFDYNVVMSSKGNLSSMSQLSEKDISIINLNNFINKYCFDSFYKFSQKYPLSSEVDYMNITDGLSRYYRQTLHLSDDNQMFHEQINNMLVLSNDQYGFVCVRCILMFGIKLAMMSNDNENFKTCLENYDTHSIHNITGKKSVKYRFVRKQSILPEQNGNKKLLISFNEIDSGNNSLAENNEVSKINNRSAKLKNNEKTKFNTKFTSKSLNDMEKLPYVLIDPYVYLECLHSIRDLVSKKKAFIVVPKLVTDFLNGLKEKNYPNSLEASEFLAQEFFRGSRMIRFIRDSDRLELELLNYPSVSWNRTIDLEDGNNVNIDEFGGANTKQDSALFYELLEHCHYLIVNRVLVNKYNDTIGFNANDTVEQNLRLILLTNSAPKWPSSACDIAQTYGIEIKSMERFIAEENAFKLGASNKSKKSKGKPSQPNRSTPPLQNLETSPKSVPKLNTIQSYGKIQTSRRRKNKKV